MTPRHVLCFLGRDRDLCQLSEAAAKAVRDFATGFSVDEDYSQAEPDDRMNRSFDVCWDRVEPDAWNEADEKAVADHQSVLYVLGPSMARADTVEVSMTALRLVERLIEAGAVAVKGESAGIAHGLDRWRELIGQGVEAQNAGDPLAQQRVGRLAFAKRPLSARGYLESVGFHLVGLPDVYVPETAGSERQVVAIIDAVADEIGKQGLDRTLKARGASLSFDSTYDVDEFKFNPYGIVKVAG
ncbi:hypothetical conserved protein (plasmid) [Rhizobium etli CFN 42]|uniref:Hypothetical conserved protein n=1 Tax=Rhizobium etli (strain ATCC 51251 / DSM 11541 / JCM 21823 / NBRC 15573 / CFN 42) TaxID=347834 RepID=Q2JYL9_RHIEC|nr:hypothetical conserved protein [Rhizobium etli CFN 42]